MPSEYNSYYGTESLVFDDFSFSNDGTLENAFIWVGWYDGAPITLDGIDLFLYEDDGGQPTNPIPGGEFWSNAATSSDWTETQESGSLTTYDIDIPEGSRPVLDSGTEIWLTFQVEISGALHAGAALDQTGIMYGYEALFWGFYDGQNYGVTPISDILGTESNACFVLNGSYVGAVKSASLGEIKAAFR